MESKLLKDMYDCFYTPPALLPERQEVEECHQALIKALEKPERRLSGSVCRCVAANRSGQETARPAPSNRCERPRADH